MLALSDADWVEGVALALSTPKSAAHSSSRTSTGMVTRDMNRASVGFDKGLMDGMSLCGGSVSDEIAGERHYGSTRRIRPGIADLARCDHVATEVLEATGDLVAVHVLDRDHRRVGRALIDPQTVRRTVPEDRLIGARVEGEVVLHRDRHVLRRITRRHKTHRRLEVHVGVTVLRIPAGRHRDRLRRRRARLIPLIGAVARREIAARVRGGVDAMIAQPDGWRLGRIDHEALRPPRGVLVAPTWTVAAHAAVVEQ